MSSCRAGFVSRVRLKEDKCSSVTKLQFYEADLLLGLALLLGLH